MKQQPIKVKSAKAFWKEVNHGVQTVQSMKEFVTDASAKGKPTLPKKK